MAEPGKRILIFYTWDRLWSLGPGKGSPDFYLSLKALTSSFDKVLVVHPAGSSRMCGELPEGAEDLPFRWPGNGWTVGVPEILQSDGKAYLFIFRTVLFLVNWFLRLFNYLAFNLSAYRAGMAVADSFNPAIVAAYGYLAVPAARLAARKLGVPLVVRLFGVSLGMKGFSTVAKIAQFEETLSFKLGAERWVITNDGSGGDEVASRLGVPASRVVYLLCGVDRDSTSITCSREDYRKELGLPEDTLVILRVSRLWRQQRVDRLIRAMPRILRDGRPVAAVIVGDGPERKQLEILAGNLGVTAVFTGAIENSGLSRHYRSSDLYAATSDRTNLSHAVLEALCHGLPVVALDTGRTSTLIRDGVNGRLVGIEESDRLGQILSELLSNDGLRHSLSEGAWRTARELIPDLEERVKQEVLAFDLSSFFPQLRR